MVGSLRDTSKTASSIEGLNVIFLKKYIGDDTNTFLKSQLTNVSLIILIPLINQLFVRKKKEKRKVELFGLV
jgi:hypothetical protein